MTTATLVHGRVTWINIVRPTQEDIDALGRAYPQFHRLNLQDCLSPLEYPKLEDHQDHLFLVTHWPVYEKLARLSQATEIDLFIARGLIVTVHQGRLAPLVTLWDQCERDEEARESVMAHGASPLLYVLLARLVDYCFPILRQVDANVQHIEQHLLADDTRHILTELAVVRRDLIALRRILRPQVDIARALETGSWPFIHEELDLYWSDLSDHLRQLSAMIEDDTDVINGLAETIDTLASHRIDEVVRLLTLATTITLPLTVVSTIYSMNVDVPGKGHPLTFFAVVALGLAITLGVWWYLRRRNWL